MTTTATTTTTTTATTTPSSISPNSAIPTPIDEEVVEIDGQRIGYCRYGTGPNFILAICGAVGCYRKDWPASVLKHFDPSFVTMICFDPPGYGVSRPPDRRQEINRSQKDAVVGLHLMEHLNLTPFTVIGWSEGARTAVHVAGQGKAEKVCRMVLLAAGTRVDTRGVQFFQGTRNTDQWLASGRAPYLAHYPEEFVRKQWADLVDVVQKVHEDLGGRFPSDYLLPGIRVPSLVMNGGMDRFCGDVKYFQQQLKDCRVETHAQGGHDFYVRFPRWFGDAVQKFIRDTPLKH